jgi:type II secretory pathway pseudopilin PulG
MKTPEPKPLSKGFTLVETVIFLLIIVVLCCAGWFIWHKSHQRANEVNDQALQNQPQNSQNKNQQVTDFSESDRYLVIKEWNMRIALPKSLQGDIDYFMDDTAEKLSGGPVLVALTSQKFSARNAKCQEANDYRSREILAVDREIGSDTETMNPQPFKEIGDDRYYFVTTACGEMIEKEGSPQDRQLLEDIKSAFTTGLEND